MITTRSCRAWMLRLATCGVASLFLGTAHSASLRLAPVNIEIAAPATASLLRIDNTGGLPVAIQVRTYAWTQVDGEDVLTPTNAVAASPPVGTAHPDKQQVIRVIRTLQSPVESEESYRLLIDELPSNRGSGSTGPALKMLLRYSVPVFFNQGPAPRATLAWSAQINETGLALSASNGGNRRVKLTQLKIESGELNLEPFGQGLTGYVLAGQTRSWQIDLNETQRSALGAQLNVSAFDGTETRNAPVALGTPR